MGDYDPIQNYPQRPWVLPLSEQTPTAARDELIDSEAIAAARATRAFRFTTSPCVKVVD